MFTGKCPHCGGRAVPGIYSEYCVDESCNKRQDGQAPEPSMWPATGYTVYYDEHPSQFCNIVITQADRLSGTLTCGWGFFSVPEKGGGWWEFQFDDEPVSPGGKMWPAGTRFTAKPVL